MSVIHPSQEISKVCSDLAQIGSDKQKVHLLARNGKLSLAAKPQSFLSFFYKPKYARIQNAFNDLIIFLQAHQKELSDENFAEKNIQSLELLHAYFITKPKLKTVYKIKNIILEIQNKNKLLTRDEKAKAAAQLKFNELHGKFTREQTNLKNQIKELEAKSDDANKEKEQVIAQIKKSSAPIKAKLRAAQSKIDLPTIVIEARQDDLVHYHAKEGDVVLKIKDNKSLKVHSFFLQPMLGEPLGKDKTLDFTRYSFDDMTKFILDIYRVKTSSTLVQECDYWGLLLNHYFIKHARQERQDFCITRIRNIINNIDDCRKLLDIIQQRSITIIGTLFYTFYDRIKIIIKNKPLQESIDLFKEFCDALSNKLSSGNLTSEDLLFLKVFIDYMLEHPDELIKTLKTKTTGFEDLIVRIAKFTYNSNSIKFFSFFRNRFITFHGFLLLEANSKNLPEACALLKSAATAPPKEDPDQYAQYRYSFLIMYGVGGKWKQDDINLAINLLSNLIKKDYKKEECLTVLFEYFFSNPTLNKDIHKISKILEEQSKTSNPSPKIYQKACWLQGELCLTNGTGNPKQWFEIAMDAPRTLNFSPDAIVQERMKQRFQMYEKNKRFDRLFQSPTAPVPTV